MGKLGDELRITPGHAPTQVPRIPRVSVIMTVRNDATGCATTLGSLCAQIMPPDEVVIVDGGSTDETLGIIQQYENIIPNLRLVSSPGANIARGRNIATTHARNEIVASTDAGCRVEPDWLANLVQPFIDDPDTEFVAGTYRVDPRSLLEAVVGAATMRGCLEPFDPETFNPSARSMAYTKSLWQRAGGWPEWVHYSEDTLWDHKMRRIHAKWVFARDATVAWRPRRTLWGVARQFYHYGTGRGHTQIGAADFAYNLRNMAIIAVAGVACVWTLWMIPVLVSLLSYFYVWTFHAKAKRVAEWTCRERSYPLSIRTYPLCIAVMWIVLLTNTLGYVVGTWQRWCDRNRGGHRTAAYLSVA